MSDNNNTLLIVGVVGLYLYMKSRQAPVYAPIPTASQNPGYNGAPSMPASTGNGWQQIAAGAVAGLLGTIAYGSYNQTSQSAFPGYQDPIYRGGIEQERVPNVLW